MPEDFFEKTLVRDAGLEPASLTAKEPKSFVFAISPAAQSIRMDPTGNIYFPSGKANLFRKSLKLSSCTGSGIGRGQVFCVCGKIWIT